jgi:hypothetical protein
MIARRGELIEALPTTRARSVKPGYGLVRKWSAARNKTPNRYNIEIQV